MKKKSKSKKKKAQMSAMGVVLIAFVGIIVAIALYQGIGPYVGTATGVSLNTITNSTITLPANGACADLNGQELVGSATITNRTAGITISSNVTVSERISSVDGLKSVGVCVTGNTFGGEVIGASSVNITYQYYDDGYIDNSGGRSTALLIPIFAALAIALLALYPTLKEGMKNFG